MTPERVVAARELGAMNAPVTAAMIDVVASYLSTRGDTTWVVGGALIGGGQTWRCADPPSDPSTAEPRMVDDIHHVHNLARGERLPFRVSDLIRDLVLGGRLTPWYNGPHHHVFFLAPRGDFPGPPRYGSG